MTVDSNPKLGIVFFSNTTENTKRFIDKIEWPNWTYRIPVKGADYEPLPDEPYVLIVPSYGTPTNSHVPPQVKKWLNVGNHRQSCVGVIGAGNLNFGDEFGASGKMLSQKLNVPLLYIFELAGTSKDIEKVKQGLSDFATTLITATT